MDLNFEFDTMVQQVVLYCVMGGVPYEEKQLVALLELPGEPADKDFEGATWSLSPTYGRHFHYLPQAKDGLLRLRDFGFPHPVSGMKLSVVGRGPSAPDPAKCVGAVFAVTVDPEDETNCAIYTGVEER